MDSNWAAIVRDPNISLLDGEHPENKNQERDTVT